MKNLLFVLWLLYLNPCVGQIGGPPKSIHHARYGVAIRHATAYMDSLRLGQHIPGLSVCVGNKNGVLWAQGFGFADIESQQPVSIHSRFRLGSVSKSLTSVALGKLIEDRQLDPDAPIGQYLPDVPAGKSGITARQLATHTSGIRHYKDGDPLACPQRYVHVRDALPIFWRDSLLFEPGTKYQYSTYGYSLLSAVMESAASTDFPSLMQSRVFSSLGMLDTGPDYSDSIVANRVRFYELRNGKPVNAALVDNSYKWAGGGFLSTPADLVKLGTSLLTGAILKRQTIDLIFKTQLLKNGTDTQYGFGWRIGKDYLGRKIVHHGGLIDGGRAFIILYPDDDLVIAVTANISGAAINLREMDRIVGYFFKTKP